jgi:iron(II)-dependent oxidoreductase
MNNGGMPPLLSAPPAAIDSPEMRRAGRDLLSLALMDARNHTLHLLDQFESSTPSASQRSAEGDVPLADDLQPVWLAGHIGWMAEAWLGRNTQRARARPGRHQELLAGDAGEHAGAARENRGNR